jgi:hypothetical protein
MPSMATVRLVLRERDAFYPRAYGEDQTPSLSLRHFAKAHVNGDFVPVAPDETEPLNPTLMSGGLRRETAAGQGNPNGSTGPPPVSAGRPPRRGR